MINFPGQGYIATGFHNKNNEINADANVESRRHMRLDAFVERSNGSRLTVSAQYESSVTRDNFTRASETSNVYAQPKIQSVANKSEPTLAASNILGFIAQRLGLDAAEGDDTEALQSRLQAGLDGFLKGYGEAREQLLALGQLNGDVLDAVDKTYKDVLTGIADLAQEYGLENPAADLLAEIKTNEEELNVDAVAQTVNASNLSLSAEMLQARTFEFEVKTAEGDIVLIRALAEQSGSYSSNADGKSISASSSTVNQFSFSVEGELNSDEITALNDLLDKVSDLSATFYSGNLEGAFEQALSLGYDDEQIASFSLNLTMSTYTRVDDSYGKVARQGERPQPQEQSANKVEMMDAKVARMAAFIQQLEKIRLEGESMGIAHSALGSLLDKSVGQEHSAVRQHAERFLSALQNINPAKG
ncbi:DUF5610 domain-containing protein [Saccharophagus degradans]|uniref:DUF5610 domain-containing protein n=1 Tax=Saccharophagus degradans TaxID=86304 RepID=A0AAW7XBB1_9GAMM|nr:DUF5610 domain-containing protein [Saccharophagus degradans]MDO6424147.1 DUF5610 domain-containing protein [Saccharophagus degradans]MDO6608194.1 DUF5610 domain-containing protein [Saccharophagus degradans]